MPEEAEFTAQIKELKVKTTADECLTGRISLEFPPNDEVIITLKRLYQPDTNVRIIIMEEE